MTSHHPFTNPIVLSICTGLLVYLSARRAQSYRPKGNAPLYASRFFQGAFIPVAFIIFLSLLETKRPEILIFFLTKEFLALTVSLGSLLLLMPILRRFLQAESCAALWCICHFLPLVSLNESRWTIPLSFRLPGQTVLSGLFWVWLTGFVAVLAWHTVRHFLFRRRLLKNATPLDGNVSAAFHKRLQIANISSRHICAVSSPNAKAPVAVGVFGAAYLVLPEKDYTQEELSLIFQHEIIHISRGDSFYKLSLTLLSAFLWFHPLVWVALRICAADLELSCDEAVVYGRTPEDRKAYAALLLDTQAEAQGFTTCLSASAKALRYRLKNIVHPKKRIVGAIIVGLICYGLLFLGMNLGVRFAPAPAGEQIFHGEDLSQIEITQVMSTVNGVDTDSYGADRALLPYIADLSVSKTDDAPDVYEFGNWVQIDLRSPTYGYRIAFGGNYLQVDAYDYSLPDNAAGRHTADYYRLDTPPDWDYLVSCITPKK